MYLTLTIHVPVQFPGTVQDKIHKDIAVIGMPISLPYNCPIREKFLFTQMFDDAMSLFDDNWWLRTCLTVYQYANNKEALTWYKPSGEYINNQNTASTHFGYHWADCEAYWGLWLQKCGYLQQVSEVLI